MEEELKPKIKNILDSLNKNYSKLKKYHCFNIFAPVWSPQIKVLFAHPQSAGHGLTLTKATTCIWCSPTYNAEHFQQFNRRIHRSGQTNKTETILIAARDTWEETVYEKLDGKLGKMENLLQVLNKLHNQEESNE